MVGEARHQVDLRAGAGYGDVQSPFSTGLIEGSKPQKQFPDDMEVFHIDPPALDEYRRWADAWLTCQRAARAAAMAGEWEADPS